jgi:hypothetical protein
MIVIWGGSSSCFVDSIQIAQNKIIRNLFGHKFPFFNTDMLYNHMGFLKVQEIYYLELGKLMHSSLHLEKCKKFKALIDALNWQHNWATRRINEYRLPQARVNVNRNGVLFSGISLWNQLPTDVKNSETTVRFKKNMEKFLDQ